MISVINNRTTTLMRSFLESRYYNYVYPSIFILGILIRSTVSNKFLENARKNWYFASSKNPFNQLFAYSGNTIFGVLFVGLFPIKLRRLALLRIGDHTSSQHKEQAIRISGISIFKEYIFKFVVKYVVLMLSFHFIDNIFLKTGGTCRVSESMCNGLASSSKSFAECSKYNGTWVHLNEGASCYLTPIQIATVIKSAELCKHYNGSWKGGFDVSGHFCFLITISLILWNELSLLESDQYDINLDYLDAEVYKSWFSISVLNFWRWVALVVLIIWTFLISVTSVFYHTFYEKLIGLIMGYITPVILYCIVPKIKILSRAVYSPTEQICKQHPSS